MFILICCIWCTVLVMTCPNFLFHLQHPSCLGTLSPVSSPSSFLFCLFCWSVYDQTLRSPAPLHCMNILIKIISHDMHTTRILVYLLCRIQTNKCDFGTTNKSCLHLKKKISQQVRITCHIFRKYRMCYGSESEHVVLTYCDIVYTNPSIHTDVSISPGHGDLQTQMYLWWFTGPFWLPWGYQILEGK